MNTTALVPNLRAAIVARRSAALRQLFDDHGLAFSNAVTACLPRAAADALSLLPPAQRNAVLRHMPSSRRTDPAFAALLASLHLARAAAGACA